MEGTGNSFLGEMLRYRAYDPAEPRKTSQTDLDAEIG